jgi:hypothetical protein
MKIALCFSGQPRFVEYCAPSILENVIQNYDVDIFGHLWFDDELQSQPYKWGGNGGWKDQRIEETAIDSFKKIYNPIKLVTEKSKKFKDEYLEEDFEKSQKAYWAGSINSELEPNFKERQINNCLSYFYSLSEVNKLKQLYEFENKFKYDYVIRCRTDSIVGTQIKFENYNREYFHCTSLQQQPPFINDWINFGGSDIMEVFMGVFPLCQRIIDLTKYKNDGTWCIELIHSEILDLLGVVVKTHPISVSLPRF